MNSFAWVGLIPSGANSFALHKEADDWMMTIRTRAALRFRLCWT
jgi:hypothetical protein